MKRRLIYGVWAFVALLTLVCGLNFKAVAQVTTPIFSYLSKNAVVGGITQGAAALLPFKVDADSDGVSGHLVVDCATGCTSGGGGGTAASPPPYNAAAGGQTAQTHSFTGIAGYNGTTVDPLLSTGGGQLEVALENSLPAGSNTIGSIGNAAFGITGALPAGSNTIGGINIASALPAGTNAIGSITNTTFGLTGALPAGSNNIGTVTDSPPLTGLSTPNPGAANQAMVASCNFTTTPATMPTTTVAPVQCDNTGHVETDIVSIAQSPISGNIGFAGSKMYGPDLSAGGCSGYEYINSTSITRSNGVYSLTASEANTQLIGLVASKYIHICSITLSGTLSTGGAINVTTGTGTACGTGTATVWTYNAPASAFQFQMGTGEMSIIDSANSSEICVNTGAFVATAGPTLDISYAQY